jgi:ribosome-binding factor A
MNKGYSRADRVADLLKEEISQMLCTEVKDPHIGFITITDVEVSKDLQLAKVFYTILGDERQLSESSDALQRVSPFIKRQLGKRLRMRFIPDILFRYDHSLDYGSKIDTLLDQLKNTQPADTTEK